MTITLQDIQAALIAKLKAATSVTFLITDGAKEIRELEWVGSVFTYPNVRVRVESFSRIDADCDKFNVTASVYVFGENASSKTCNTIASAIFDLVDTHTLKDNTVSPVTRIKATQFGADYIPDAGVWRAEVKLTFQER
jgi:hypothetical protein